MSAKQASQTVTEAIQAFRCDDAATGAARYEDVVERLSREPNAVALLQSLAADEELPALSRRVAWILAEKIKHPERFSIAAEHFEPDESYALDLLNPPPRLGRRPRLARMRMVRPEVLSPHLRRAAEQHPDAFAKLRGIYEEVQTRAAAALERPDQERPSAKELLDWALEEKRKVLAQQEMSDLDKRVLDAAAGAGFRGRASHHLNPDFLPAWEEGLLRPDVQPGIKLALSHFVEHIDHPGSAPVLAEMVREAFEHVDHDRQGPWPSAHEKTLSRGLHVLLTDPSDEALQALVDLDSELRGDARRALQRGVKSRLERSEEWRQFISRSKADPKLKSAAERFEAMAAEAGWRKSSNDGPE